MSEKRGSFDDGLFAGFALGWSVALEVHGIEIPSPQMDRIESVLRDVAAGRLTLLLPVDDIARQDPQTLSPRFEAILREHAHSHMAEERDHAKRMLRMIYGAPPPA
jgi:hypothetical protein